MLKKFGFLVLIGLVFIGCASQTRQRTYREIIDSDYFAAERLSPQFLKELKKECPSMINDLESLKKQLAKEKASGNQKAGEKTSGEIKWLTGWIRMAGCEYEVTGVPEPITEKKAISHETAPSEVSMDKKAGQSTSERRDRPSSVTPLTFDECFQKCRDLTSRTNEECFDTCLGR